MNVTDLVEDPSADIEEIARHLDGLDGETRWREVEALSRSQQRALYEKASASPPIELAHFVNGAKPLEEVVHDGKNTLPFPAPFQHFQKRFCRTDQGNDQLFGYNEGITRRPVGPGYFVTVTTQGRPTWQARGPVVIDYFRVPEGPVVDGWPRVVSNTHGLQRFVYAGTRDFMRRVSEHVSIGAAYKGERPLDHYFVLCRRG